MKLVLEPLTNCSFHRSTCSWYIKIEPYACLSLNKTQWWMDKLAAWVMNTGKVLFAALFSPLFLDTVFSYGLGIRKDRVIRALYKETQLQSHTAESWRHCFIKKQHHWNAKCDRSHCLAVTCCTAASQWLFRVEGRFLLKEKASLRYRLLPSRIYNEIMR